uniref:E3 ubiquitin-protein ligase HERC2 isoform X1 n=1 Tax=Macaca mulatta TaxID=9544 RepID=UPI0010A204D4|nr:E3 ubiquitin-protein ligase HERC2 isoform X1 [Macaca mulatta]XP_028706447.1 E3 ubiquitin-protein ligase HERC2 isoform X1 [Macaca mulatta]
MLSFTFAFLRRAWRSGEDADLCSELLQESLDALGALPEASLFDESTVSSVWLEVVERATRFLRSVVTGSGQRPPEQPEADGGDPGQQRGRTEHRAVGRPVRAAERLVRAAAHRQGAGRALSALLPCAVSGNDVNISPGRRFMIDLLVGSLMADGGLESALHAAITAEIQDIEAKKEAQKEKEIDEQEVNASTFHRSRTPLDKDLINTGICESSGKQYLPLVQLMQQLLSLFSDYIHTVTWWLTLL